MDAADRLGGTDTDPALDGAIREAARRLVAEAREEVLTEVKEVLRARLLDAAMRELTVEHGPGPVSEPPQRPRRAAGATRDIEETVRAIGSLTDDDDPVTAEVADSPPRGEGLYAYGVCSRRVPTPASAGIGGRSVDLVDVGDHHVLVTPVPLAEFEGDALERRLTDPAWLGEQATAHERVLVDAMQDGAVLPLRFGTIFRDEDQLRDSLAPNASLFAKAMARAESRAEWDVKVVCDAGTLGAWIEGGNPRIAGLLAEATESGEGGAYLRRKRLDRAIAEEADRAREELGRVVHEALAACSEATAPAGAAGEPEPGGRVLVRADAYLVHRERSEEFRRAAGATETLLADRGVEVRITGPLPLYHFVSIDLREVASD